MKLLVYSAFTSHVVVVYPLPSQVQLLFYSTFTSHVIVVYPLPSQVQLLFYSAFTSHVEVALTLACDTAVGAALLHDWLANVRTDLQLRLNLNRLRSGHYEVASRDHGERRSI